MPDRMSTSQAEAWVAALRARSEPERWALGSPASALAALAGAVDRVRQAHQPIPVPGDGLICKRCFDGDGIPSPWPCETLVVLDGDPSADGSDTPEQEPPTGTNGGHGPADTEEP